MKTDIVDFNDRISYCLVEIDAVDDELKNLLKHNLIEIVNGKLEAERVSDSDDDERKECLEEAKKYIYSKSFPNHRVGIVGELLFHCLMRYGKMEQRFMSLCPTIGYSDCYKSFYKGFDGCYYAEGRVWIAEVKSKIKSTDLDIDNEDKMKVASSQIETEANDTTINRWQKSKTHVYQQLSEIERGNIEPFKLFTGKKKNEYNQMLCTLLICDNGTFNKRYIESYIETLYHKKVEEQKIFAICIRSFDYEKIIDFIKNL